MMDIFEELNEENFTLFAIRHYDNPQCTSTEEFYEDIRRFRYLKRLLKRYHKTGELRERLILNHLIVIFNVFDIEAGLNILELKLEVDYWNVIKPFLLFLNVIKNDEYTNIKMDKKVVDKLREIKNI